ncbi:hypothetical protein [Thermococcus profundus]|uniref:hypothetical protein n=1 Tax=Thermococcus profundus TaxID=49899 RepID=UPI0012FD6D40|nr:hypothetical protein [Thermococcus profundus]
MEKADAVGTLTPKNSSNSSLNQDKKQKIKRFRGILGKISEETILWAIKEAEEL